MRPSLAPPSRPPSLLLLSAALGAGGCAETRIGRPEDLWLLWLVPVVALFFVWVARVKRRLLARFADSELLPRLAGGVSRRRQALKAALVLVGLGAALLALAEVKYGFTWEEIERVGVDIVVALDVSDSMLVEDAESGGGLSRLERAKREIADLLEMLEGDRIALVAFAGTAFVECPLTLDYGAAALFLDDLSTDLIPVKGTSLAAAIDTSLAAFEGGTHPSRAIILITDGEDHDGKGLEAAEKAAAAGVRIFAIGIGRDEGAPIPRADGGFRSDRRGEIILSRLDEPTLQKMALATGGRYVRSVSGDVDLEQIYFQGIKATLVDRELGSRRRQRWEDRFQWLLALSLAALMLEPLISARRRQRSAAAILAAALVLAAAPAAAQPPAPTGDGAAATFDDPFAAYAAGAWDQALAGFLERDAERPGDPALAVDVGSAHYQLGNFAEADRFFERATAAGEPAVRAQALYSLGNSAYRQGRLEDAVSHYRATLELDPDDGDAKYNLELVREELERRRQEARERQERRDREDQESQSGESGGADPGDDGAAGAPQPQQGGTDETEGERPAEAETAADSGAGDEPPPAPGPDADGDGLADEIERGGDNPTDPANPDTDGDGLADGAEDASRDGRLDPGETDPNRADTDGDGVPDGAETAAGGAAETAGPLTLAEAERYLQAIEEGRPLRRAPAGARRQGKDW